MRDTFLKNLGLETETLVSLPVDCSQRRYFRLSKGLLMDASPPYEDTFQFQFIAEFLKKSGLSVPDVYAADHTHGFLFIEDFGDLPYRKALQHGLCEKLVYGETIRALAHLHQFCESSLGFDSQKPSPPNLQFPTYTQDLFVSKASLFIEWADFSFSRQAKEDFKGLWEEAYLAQPQLPLTFALRDVMVDNLLWLSERESFKRCGFIDFQDGAWAPITYDLVSLLEDARRDIAPSFAMEMVEIYFQAFPHLSREDFWASYYLWGAQRTLRILGVFFRLAKREGKSQYLAHVPRLWRTLERDLQHPALRTLRKWFEVHKCLG